MGAGGWPDLTLTSANVVAKSADLRVFGSQDSLHAYLYVRDLANGFGTGSEPGDMAARTLSGRTVTIGGMASSQSFHATYYDTWDTATPLGELGDETVVSTVGGQVTLNLPSFQRDLAVQLVESPSTPTPLPTSTFTPTATQTDTDTPLPPPTPTVSDTLTSTSTPTDTHTPVPPPSNTSTSTATRTTTPTNTPLNTLTFTATPTASDTPVPTNTPTATQTTQTSMIRLSYIDYGSTAYGGYRWRDVAGNLYSDAYRNSYSYDATEVEVEITFDTEDATFHGSFVGANLKPNFAYQLKLSGEPGTTGANELIGRVGRWWQEEWNGSEWTNGQNLNNKGDGSTPNPNDLVYISRRDIEDPSSPTERKYRYNTVPRFRILHNGRERRRFFDIPVGQLYHVLWNTVQRSPASDDGPVESATFVRNRRNRLTTQIIRKQR